MSPTNLETIGSAGPANDNLSRFVVALDESQQSLDALKWMLEHMASPERNLLICLHVTDTIDPMKLPRRMDWSQLSGEKGIEALHVHTPEDSPILQNARKMVRAQVQGKEPEQQVLFCEYVHQTPKVGICEFAKEQRADLIVTGKRGISGLKRLVMGSISEYIVHNSHCSVLVYEDGEKHKKQDA